MKKTALLFSCLLCAAPVAWSADLLSSYRAALAFDAAYAAARAAADAGREKLAQGRAGLLPSVSATANTTWNDIDGTVRFAAATPFAAKYNSNGWQVTLTQPLFRWQNWAAYNIGELQAAQAEANFALARMNLVVRVAQAYFDVLLAQEALATTQAQKTAISEQLAAARRNFEVGTSTITDAHEAQARFDLAAASELFAQNDLQVKREALRNLVGPAESGDAALKTLKNDPLINPPQPNNIDAWAQSAESGYPGVVASEAGFAIADLEAGRQRAGHYPTLDLVATKGRSSQASTLVSGSAAPGSDANAATVGLQLVIPIFSGGATASREREAVALREKSRAERDNARRSAALQAREAYLGVTSGLAQIKAYEAALASSQLSLESNKLGYDVGVRINIDVLNAQSQLFDTRQKLVKARLDTLAGLLKLKAATGQLGEEDLAKMNVLLQ